MVVVGCRYLYGEDGIVQIGCGEVRVRKSDCVFDGPVLDKPKRDKIRNFIRPFPVLDVSEVPFRKRLVVGNIFP